MKVGAAASMSKASPTKPLEQRKVECVVFFSLAFVSSIVYAACGLGYALVTMCLAICASLFHDDPSLGVLQVAIYIIAVVPFATFCQACHFSRSEHLNIPFSVVYGIFVFIGMILGQVLMIFVANNKDMVYVLELLLLIALATQLVSEGFNRYAKTEETAEETMQSIPDLHKPGTAAIVSMFSTIAGFFQGSITVGGPTKIFMVILLKLSKDTWRATQSLGDLPLQLARLIVLLIHGMVSWTVDGPILLCMLVSTGCGLYVGNKLSHIISQKIFINIMLAANTASVVMLSIRLSKHLHSSAQF